MNTEVNFFKKKYRILRRLIFYLVKGLLHIRDDKLGETVKEIENEKTLRVELMKGELDALLLNFKNDLEEKKKTRLKSVIYF